MVAIFLDFSAAFDSISIHFVLSSLRRLRVPERIIDRVEILLRTKRFFYNDDPQARQYFPIHGVPQGSPLSPVRYLCATLALYAKLRRSFELVIYADDTTALIPGFRVRGITEKVGALMAELSKVLPPSNLKLNTSKSKFLIFNASSTTRKKLKSQLLKVLSPSNISPPSSTSYSRIRYLGFSLTANLSTAFDLARLRKFLRIAALHLPRARKLRLSEWSQVFVWNAWAISGLVFFSRGRPPEQRLRFLRLFMRNVPKVVSSHWLHRSQKDPSWLAGRIQKWVFFEANATDQCPL